MTTRDTFYDVAALTHPLPARPQDEHDLDGWSQACEEVTAERERYAENLRLSWEDAGHDPLLGAVSDAREAMLQAEKRMRQLIAYGREFIQPRPYTLDDLARAAGMSISGVRTAYDTDEVAAVAEHTGAKPRPRPENRP